MNFDRCRGQGRAERRDHELYYRLLRYMFLCVYIPATLGDWIQGPYLYALYSNYGFGMQEIGYIFVMGYLSSAIFGTYVGVLGDK